jgi:hypothetical protein
MSQTEELKQVDFHENKQQAAGGKPSIASKLEKEAAELQKKRQSLSKDDVENKLKEAEERRQVRITLEMIRGPAHTCDLMVEATCPTTLE